jgi:arabinofuranosyltransferase
VTPRRIVALVVLMAAGAVALCVGWKEVGFVCDDAYIAFRYVANRRADRGYTWNPPPFVPVEGYTSFLWLVLLDLAWTFGVEPPAAARALGLAAAFTSVGLIAATVLRLPLSAALARFRVALLAIVLFAVLSNRTFLAWTSSGLETPLFVALVLGWVYASVFVADGRSADLTRIALASLLALCRPDGVLFVAASIVHVAPRVRSSGSWLPFMPIAVPLVHLAWRRGYYGDWLPNTYYAKYVEPWPAAGAIYVASFLLEYAYWAWILLALAAAVRSARSGAATRLWSERRGLVVVAGALAAHFAYYTFVIGGDHFEFRVYAHLVPLVAVSLPKLADTLGWPVGRTLATSVAVTALGLPLPWVHWCEARWDTDWQHLAPHPVARHFPAPFRIYAKAWDATQAWLHARLICVRLHEHKAFVRFMRAQLPSRDDGERVTWTDFPIAGVGSVGLAGWALPNVGIIDLRGLNDRVIARAPIPTPHEPSQLRSMAHDRAPPPGYLDCFRPNVGNDPNGIIVVPRMVPMTAEEIVDCEREFGGRP